MNCLPEFEDYHFLGEDRQNVGESNIENGFLTSLLHKCGQMAFYLKEKVIEMKLKEKIKVTSQKAYLAMKATSGYIAVKSEPLIEKFKEKTSEGVQKAKEYLTKISPKNENPIMIDPNKTQIIKENISTDTTEVNPSVINYINEEAIPDSSYGRLSQYNLNKNNSFTLLDNSPPSSPFVSIHQDNYTVAPCLSLPTYEEIVMQNEKNLNVQNINEINLK